MYDLQFNIPKFQYIIDYIRITDSNNGPHKATDNWNKNNMISIDLVSKATKRDYSNKLPKKTFFN